MSYPRFVVCLLVAVAVVTAVYAAMYARPWESAAERAHRLCEGCGIEVAEVDWLIETMQTDGEHKTRDELFQVWLDTHEDDEEGRLQPLDLCRPCVEAVLDTVGE